MDKEELHITTISLYQSQVDFFNEKHIRISRLIRDLICNYPEYREWRERNGKRKF